MSALQVHRTEIPGLLIVDLPVHGDNRGWFKENWQREKMVAAGLPDLAFVQNNISFNADAGTTRGIHAEPWDKYVSVATGRIFAAWVDLREGPDFGTVVTAELGPDRAALVPRGVGNSFQTLEDSTAYTYLVTDHWSGAAQEQYTFVNAADPSLGIQWPIPLEQAERSSKDLEHPALKDVEPMRPAPLLILGTSGQLGSALVTLCTEKNVPFQAYARDEWDMSAPGTWPVQNLRGYRAVINTTAYTAVDEAQTAQGRRTAWAVNGTGVSALSLMCAHAAVPLLHVSTDYVFDGTLAPPAEYDVDTPVAPLSVYGQSKAAGEMAVRSIPRHWMVRTSWVIGAGEHAGKNFVRTMKMLADKDVDPSVVDDQLGRLTFADDLAAALLDMVTGAKPYGTYHVTNAGPVVSWAQVARWVFQDSGHDPQRISAVSTEEYFQDKPDAAPRPINAALSTVAARELEIRLPEARDQLARLVRAEQAAG
ncbi:sugar nucleotide-binding protein [Kocuria sp.]|uniref:sugar nucleotide-binding protein n=1 Tax=Kocuria sp. TaxID=1871328 RepID=UPI0026DEE141|nr:sugar nucleotide-binding protein [Kocuria sp.]MDO5618399.1 sugar nucleotide-binding protein [Kocuria sp.]